MKKIIISALLASVFISCANLNTVGTEKSNDFIKDIFTENTSENTDVKTTEEVESVDITLTSENVSEYLNEIKNSLKSSEKIVETEVKNNYDIYIGKYLIAPLDNETNVRLTSSPRNSTPRLKVENGNFSFRTIYAGNYGLSVYNGASLTRRINIRAITKYNFSETNIYDIILENSEKNNKTLEDALTLYKMYYPTGANIKRVNYILLKYGYENDNSAITKEAIGVLKSDLNSFNDEEKALIIKAAMKVNSNIFISNSTFNTTNPELKNSLKEYVSKKEILDKKEVRFIENSIKSGEISPNSEIGGKVDSWYQNNTNSTKDTENSTIKNVAATKQVKETFYDKAMKTINSDPKASIDNFKKSLSRDNLGEKRSEVYYNIANSYLKLGNRVEAMKYITLLKQQYPNSDWMKKASLLFNLGK